MLVMLEKCSIGNVSSKHCSQENTRVCLNAVQNVTWLGPKHLYSNGTKSPVIKDGEEIEPLDMYPSGETQRYKILEI